MDKKKLLRISGKIFFTLAVINFLGLPDLFGSTKDASHSMFYSIFSELLSVPDFKTIGLAGISAFIGYKLRQLCAEDGESTRTGTKLMVGGIVCIVLTFTPVSWISMLPASFNLSLEEAAIDGYNTVPEDDYVLYAFLGSASSKPEDVDLFDYQCGYDGRAREEYKKYKICGYISNQTEEPWFLARIEFVLVDADGNDILADGEPVVLQTVERLDESPFRKLRSTFFQSREDLKMTVDAGSLGKFETNTVKAKGLSAQPVHFRVKSVQQADYEGVELDFPIE